MDNKHFENELGRSHPMPINDVEEMRDRSRSGSLAATGELIGDATLGKAGANGGIESSFPPKRASGVDAGPLVQPVKIGAQHFELLKLVGKGAFGRVILARNLINDCTYAMKVISKKLLRKKNNVLYMKAERNILTKVSR